MHPPESAFVRVPKNCPDGADFWLKTTAQDLREGKAKRQQNYTPTNTRKKMTVPKKDFHLSGGEK